MKLRVRHHGANPFSRWLFRRCRPLGNLYYFAVRKLLTYYEASTDGGRTWERVA